MTKKITKLMLNGEEYEIREYQGGWWGWRQPWANTVAYFPLEDNSNEASWKVVTTADYSVNYSTIWWVKCANATSSSWYIGVSTSIFDGSSAWTEQTISFWMYLNALPWWTSNWVFEFEKKDYYSFYFLARSNNVYRYEWVDAWSTIDVSISNDDIWRWNYFTLVNSSSWKYMYKNWVPIGSWTWSSRPRWNRPNNYQENMVILNARTPNERLKWWLRELIFENKCWTVDEIADYYNQTKDQYQSSEPQTEPCHICWGTGEEECNICGWTWQEMCPNCWWTGQIWDPEDPESRTPCPDCDGGGFISCWNCGWTWTMTCSNCGWTWVEPWE